MNLSSQLLYLAAARSNETELQATIGGLSECDCLDLVKDDSWKGCDPASRQNLVVSVDRLAVLKRLTKSSEPETKEAESVKDAPKPKKK